MKIDASDPRWTAYALGELDDKERAELDSVLQESPEMRRLVEEIRETAAMVSEELKNESPMVLTETQRSRIGFKANCGKRTWFVSKPIWAIAGVAAVLVLIISVPIYRWQLGKAIPPQNEPIVAAMQNAPAFNEQPAMLGGDKKSPGVERRQRSVAADKLPAARAISRADVGADTQSVVVTEKKVAEPSQVNKSAVDSIDLMVPTESAKKIPPPINEIPVVGVSNSAGSISGGIAGGTPGRISGSLVSSFSTQVPNVTVNDGRYNEIFPPGRRRKPPWPPHPPMPFPVPPQGGKFNTEAYDYVADNPFMEVAQNPLSTFSIDVDTASYANMRRFLDGGTIPPKDAIRIEELINYFDYAYKAPTNEKPFAAHIELAEAPWNKEHKLLRIGLKAREIESSRRPPSNLVFLLDVSGSMADWNKLPLVKESMRLLVDQLGEGDNVAIVTYAGTTSVALPSTSGYNKERIRSAIEWLRAGGSTNGASGIQLAYETAQKSFIKDGINRVILATDGDFNVGITNRGDLTRLIEEKAKSGIYLSALGFGMGNYKDGTLESLAKYGHGNYAYIDTVEEAKKVLVRQINATLVSVAKDVKIQIEFNPRRVSSYRLIGYEDRVMPKEDFNDDTKDAGVIGAGHAVTALYEIVPAGKSAPSPGVDPLKYQKPGQSTSASASDEVATVKIRYKDPEKDKSLLSEFAVKDSTEDFGEASQDFKFAAAVAAFGMVLRDSPHKGNATLDHALDWAKEGKGSDTYGYRQEFIRLIHRAISIAK